ncbi:hypothetical protein NLI96_g3622 [Meripilus lineatus]|uniref:Uncharacterized protein n=1 Tax=Meripilus lineatus TaxID=2056292 RepID=A0AAD5VBW0_9APHY|nr:hypothetical protein NLI96_g3622 [Physisporinus lineatus]
MVDWNSPNELQNDATVGVRLIHVLAGVYFWEFVISLHFEWSYIRGTRKLHWPLIPYFLGRYSALGGLIGSVHWNVTVITSSHSSSCRRINCQALMLFLSMCGSLMVGCSTATLALRTMAIWSMSWKCVVPLVVLILGHWAVLIQDVVVSGGEPIANDACVTTLGTSQQLMGTFIYSIGLDFIVMVLSAYKLLVQAHDFPRSRLVRLIFQDGLIYFIIVFLVNLPAAVVSSLDLNSIMNIIFALPACVCSVIASGRAVRRLTRFAESSPPVHFIPTNPGHSAVVFRNVTVTSSVDDETRGESLS